MDEIVNINPDNLRIPKPVLDKLNQDRINHEYKQLSTMIVEVLEKYYGQF